MGDVLQHVSNVMECNTKCKSSLPSKFELGWRTKGAGHYAGTPREANSIDAAA